MESKIEKIKRILNTHGMTKSDLSEVILKGNKFNDVAHDIVKLFAIHVVSHCDCSENDKHGETTIMCCNECGKPTEMFWRCG